MTSNQLTYWKNVETERANRISEQLRETELEERKRANRAQERLAAANLALAQAQLAWNKQSFGERLSYDYWNTRYKQYGEFAGIFTGLQNSGWSMTRLGEMLGETATSVVDWMSDKIGNRAPTLNERWKASQSILSQRMKDMEAEKVDAFTTNLVQSLPW